MKKIITCSDGTWNKPYQKDDGAVSPTNVYEFSRLISKTDSRNIRQLVFYDEGVGTEWYDKIRGGIFGMGINKNIIQAYTFIAENYEPGDEIYLYGFSRGAYTARSVAGFIYNSGLLRAENINKKNIRDAFLLYKDRNKNSKPSSDRAKKFRADNCYDNVTLKCIGVWDTVGSLGIPLEIFYKFNKNIINTQFYDVTLNKNIKFAFHAVAIDEHRKPFDVAMWERHPDAAEQVMEQRWFPGVHCDVGGGYRNRDLSDCTLAWMIEKSKLAGLEFNNYNIQGNPSGQMHDSMKIYYEVLGSIDRKIGIATGYIETISDEARKRWNDNADNYRKEANPNLNNAIKA